MNPQGNPTGPEHSEITENENRTQEIVAQAEQIANNLNTEEARHALEEVRVSALAGLRDLRIETATELAQAKAEIGDALHNTIDYTTGDISQDELGNITREFSDLSQMQSHENTVESPETGTFGGLMLGYIEDTNAAILSGGENEINSQIGWYLTAFGSENGAGGITANAAYYGASAVLSSETMSQSVSRLEQIKSSSGSIETKLFQLSQILYEVGKEAGAPSELEAAHNSATRTIIKRVIGNESGNFAIGFNKTTGYYTTESINSTSSELEIGTYLCSLNKSGNLSKDHLLQPNGPFSATELFIILERYKNGEFGGDDVRGLFGEYLENFDSNMQSVIVNTINSAPNPETISAVIESGLTSNPETVNTVLSHCELCSRIDEYSYEDIKAMSPEELQAYQNNENTKPFYDALLKKKETYNSGEQEIQTHISSTIFTALESINLSEDKRSEINDRINEISRGLHQEIIDYLNNTPAEQQCSLTILELIHNNEHINAFINSLETEYNITFQIENISTDILNISAQENLEINEINLSTLEGEQQRINELLTNSDLNNSQRSLLTTQKEKIEVTIQEIQENIIHAQRLRIISEALRKNENITPEKTREIAMGLIETLEEGKSFNQILVMASLQGFEGIETYNSIYREMSISEIIEKPQERINQISNKRDLLHIFNEYGDKLSDVRIVDLHPNMQKDIGVIRAFPSRLQVDDIITLPDEVFLTNSDTLHNGNILYLVSEAIERSQTSGMKIDKIFRRCFGLVNGYLPSCIVVANYIVTQGQFSERDLEHIKNSIPTNIIRSDTENTLNIIDREERINTITEGEFQNLVVRMENGGNLSLPERRLFDKFLERETLGSHQEAAELFIKKGYFKNTTYLKDAVSVYAEDAHMDSQYHILALEENPENIRYFSETLRSNKGTINALIENTDISTFKEKYMKFLIIDNYMSFSNLYDALKEKYGETTAKITMAGDIRIGRVFKKLLSLNISDERKAVVTDIMIIFGKLQNNFGTLKNNVAEQQGTSDNNILNDAIDKQILEEGLILATQILGETSADQQEILTIFLKKALNQDEPYQTEFSKLVEICGDDMEKASQLINIIAQLNIDKLDLSSNRILNSLSREGVQEGNNDIFIEILNLSEEERKTGLLEKAQDFIQSHESERYPEEEYSDFEARMEELFIESLGLTPEQQELIIQVFKNAHLQGDWAALRNLSPEDTENVVKNREGAIQALIAKHREARRAAGISPYLSTEEISGEKVFNPDTGEIELNPNYTPQEDDSATGDIPPAQNDTPAVESNFHTIEERIGGDQESPTLKSGDSTIPISQEEAKMLRTNPDAEKNLVNMYEFFKKLNLLGVWEYRNELITAVGEVTINLEDDSLAEDELLRFGKKLLNLIQKIQEEENPDAPSTINPNITSLDSLNLELSKFSGSRDLWGDDRSFNSYGDDRFEAWMRNYGIIGGITFHTNKIKKMMR